jgi:hypothetical protein
VHLVLRKNESSLKPYCVNMKARRPSPAVACCTTAATHTFKALLLLQALANAHWSPLELSNCCCFSYMTHTGLGPNLATAPTSCRIQPIWAPICL